MNRQVDAYTYQNFLVQWGGNPKEIEEIKYTGRNELTVVLKNGDVIKQDIINNQHLHYVSRPYPDEEFLDERQHQSEFAYALDIRLRWKFMSQKDLSDMTGISESTICRYLSGKSMPSSYNLAKIARALDCSIEELIYI